MVYNPDDIVAVYTGLLPVFGRVLDIVILGVTEWYFVCELFSY